jgi:hypothetical protein
MTTLPWIFVPSMIVPILFLLHFAIAARLAWSRKATRAAALAA